MATLATALVASALDRGLARLGTAWRGSSAGPSPTRSGSPCPTSSRRRGTSLLPGAEAPARGEPFGVGLASVVLLAAAALGVGALLAAAGLADRRALPGFGALAACGLLATPALDAAAAERSRDPLRARLRRDAAVRQLRGRARLGDRRARLRRPSAGGAAGRGRGGDRRARRLRRDLAGSPGAGVAGVERAAAGGDRAEPAAAVRALTGIAHYAWIAVALVLPSCSARRTPAGSGRARFGTAAVVAFLAARAALRRFAPAPSTSARQAPGAAA